jgi:hypothetical protein
MDGLLDQWKDAWKDGWTVGSMHARIHSGLCYERFTQLHEGTNPVRGCNGRHPVPVSVTGCFFYISRSSLTLFHLFLYTFYYSAVMTFNPARKQAYGLHKEAARAAACRQFF